MALREARVSLAWISRVSGGMSGARVKRVVEGELGVTFILKENSEVHPAGLSNPQKQHNPQ